MAMMQQQQGQGQEDPMQQMMGQGQQPNPMEVQAAVKKKLEKIANPLGVAMTAWTAAEAGKGVANLGLHARDKIREGTDQMRIEANPTRELGIRQEQFRRTQTPGAEWNWTGGNIGALPGQRRLFAGGGGGAGSAYNGM